MSTDAPAAAAAPVAAPAATSPAPASEPIAAVAPEDEGVKVYAGNLSYKSTSEDLKALFAPVSGEILSCEVVFRGKRSSGYGFVAYKTAEEAEKAVEALNKKEVDDRALQVEIARPPQPKERKPRVRKPRTAAAATGTGAAAGRAPRAEDAVDGEEEDAVVAEGDDAVKPKKKAPRKRNKKTAAPADGAIDADVSPAAVPKAKAPRKKTAAASRIDDETGEVVEKPAKAPRVPRPPPTGEPSETLVFVASLPFTMDDDALKALFADNGVSVTSSRIVKRPFGVRRSKGFGFVDTADHGEQLKALALDGKDLDGRAIAVKVALQHQRDPAESLEAVAAAAEEGAPTA